MIGSAIDEKSPVEQHRIGHRSRASDRLPDPQAPVFGIQISSIANHARRRLRRKVVLERRYRCITGIEEILRVQSIVATEVVNVAVKCRAAGRKRIIRTGGSPSSAEKSEVWATDVDIDELVNTLPDCGNPLLTRPFFDVRHIHSATQSEQPVGFRQRFARIRIVAASGLETCSSCRTIGSTSSGLPA